MGGDGNQGWVDLKGFGLRKEGRVQQGGMPEVGVKGVWINGQGSRPEWGSNLVKINLDVRRDYLKNHLEVILG